MVQKAYFESPLGLELKAVNFFYGGIRQMARSMPRAIMSQEMAWTQTAEAHLLNGSTVSLTCHTDI